MFILTQDIYQFQPTLETLQDKMKSYKWKSVSQDVNTWIFNVNYVAMWSSIKRST